MRKYCTDGWENSFPTAFIYWLKNVEHNWYAANNHSKFIERLTGMPRNIDLFPLAIMSPSTITIGEKVISYNGDTDWLRSHIMEVLDESRSN